MLSRVAETKMTDLKKRKWYQSMYCCIGAYSTTSSSLKPDELTSFFFEGHPCPHPQNVSSHRRGIKEMWSFVFLTSNIFVSSHYIAGPCGICEV